MHRVFISYHHSNDQFYKEQLLAWNRASPLFHDYSVDTGDIPDHWDDQTIRQEIRDEYLRDSSVTILLVGTETKRRKHIDWELYSSMYDGIKNKKSGLVIVNLPSIGCTYYTVAHSEEKNKIYPENTSWTTISNRSEYESRYPYMPERIIDNLLKSEAKVSVTNWSKIESDWSNLDLLIENAYSSRASCQYDLSRPMRRLDS